MELDTLTSRSVKCLTLLPNVTLAAVHRTKSQAGREGRRNPCPVHVDTKIKCKIFIKNYSQTHVTELSMGYLNSNMVHHYVALMGMCRENRGTVDACLYASNKINCVLRFDLDLFRSSFGGRVINIGHVYDELDRIYRTLDRQILISPNSALELYVSAESAVLAPQDLLIIHPFVEDLEYPLVSRGYPLDDEVIVNYRYYRAVLIAITLVTCLIGNSDLLSTTMAASKIIHSVGICPYYPDHMAVCKLTNRVTGTVMDRHIFCIPIEQFKRSFLYRKTVIKRDGEDKAVDIKSLKSMTQNIRGKRNPSPELWNVFTKNIEELFVRYDNAV
ncbi:CUN008 putative vp1054 virion associated assembly protein, similar to AcMNPV ORF54 [Culex nigripalpus nucleopolyhedrovirus]|uniref:CUN008 putative vp1054 virion associated assembly protein, similar to AcMNPV ORF54 n=1 Tax=Culex nigripalpus nucleopolyhedrovirus (isolate Florida/1997) TaxID=645993 RepID=Q919Q7_NPVCO|nr:CUN008 putative vp1054 virion associated assembly protein, similar to AcMNPV ORF54 [Culex nigripalpus nucleopolyhedrovirus]AAK94086.1 CUN008 putative vp1054 virion associated assembly protein, similar to AcMNPV ORF54 [Culex nigripalpus nucleopolyhedrovirus]